MEREIRVTADGFPTLFAKELNEHYHSTNGAYTESMHVFINAGLYLKLHASQDKIHILEIGLGTGLNLILTKLHGSKDSRNILYHALEPFPLDTISIEEIKGYDLTGFEIDVKDYELIHYSPFGKEINLGDKLTFLKIQKTLEEHESATKFDLVYFDAFGPQVQPEIWSEENFLKIFNWMNTGGILVTYCAKGAVRRAMQTAGFTVERIPGPPGKREMLRATKK